MGSSTLRDLQTKANSSEFGLIEKFYRCLNPGGYLFVGHAESLLGLTEKFRMVHKDSGTAYQRIEVRE